MTMRARRSEPNATGVRPGRRKLVAILALSLLLVGVVWGLLALRAPTGSDRGGQTLTDGGANGVTFKATLQATDSGLRFTVELYTHSVDIAAYDLSNIVLEDPQGARVVATEVTVLERTSHHIEAVLAFPGTASTTVTLIAEDLAGVPERRLVFDL